MGKNLRRGRDHRRAGVGQWASILDPRLARPSPFPGSSSATSLALRQNDHRHRLLPALPRPGGETRWAANLTTLREGSPNSPWWRRRRERNFHGTRPAPRYDCPPGRSQTWHSKLSPAVRTTNKTFRLGKKNPLPEIRTKVPPPAAQASSFTFLLPGEKLCVFRDFSPFVTFAAFIPCCFGNVGGRLIICFFLTGLNHSPVWIELKRV